MANIKFLSKEEDMFSCFKNVNEFAASGQGPGWESASKSCQFPATIQPHFFLSDLTVLYVEAQNRFLRGLISHKKTHANSSVVGYAKIFSDSIV